MARPPGQTAYIYKELAGEMRLYVASTGPRSTRRLRYGMPIDVPYLDGRILDALMAYNYKHPCIFKNVSNNPGLRYTSFPKHIHLMAPITILGPTYIDTLSGIHGNNLQGAVKISQGSSLWNKPHLE
jgi:hypothetical protein